MSPRMEGLLKRSHMHCLLDRERWDCPSLDEWCGLEEGGFRRELQEERVRYTQHVRNNQKTT